MPINTELEVIEEEVQRRFEPSNPITQAIAKKLVQSLYNQRRCEYLIDYARSLPQRKIDELPAQKKAEFKKNVKNILERLHELKRINREYSAALAVQTYSPSTNQ
ncbi:MAG: hypothetical protein FJW36_05715 [Acidobacteria bacterium]|nr:hypothetical protein [Acidobacteriota bacterium]